MQTPTPPTPTPTPTVIKLSRPNTPAFSLRSGFPPKELIDDSLTLEQAKLLNAQIIQKYN